MAIKWFNIRSREVLVAETEPQITALWASSDHSPNITQGQDFGWRLAPEVVVEMKRIKQDRQLMQHIAVVYNRPLEDVGEPEILQYISDQTDAANAPIAEDGDYRDQYEQEIRNLELEGQKAQINQLPDTTVTTTESLADMRERAELEERIAKAKREQFAADEAAKQPDQSQGPTGDEAAQDTTASTTQKPKTK